MPALPGGAVVGNEVERNRNTKTSWEVRIAMDSGDWRTLRYSAQPVVREGDRVRLVDNGRSLALVRNYPRFGIELGSESN